MNTIDDLRDYLDRMLDQLEHYRGFDAAAKEAFHVLRKEYESLVDTVLPPEKYKDENMEYRCLVTQIQNAFMMPGYTHTTARCVIDLKLQEAERRR
ncbi:hypothetical protein GF351_02085 [Candidatus Woesearchaeota archaeon]|nr:hypothetical protein [Candidatus Woesearchaeota archaeon]